MRLGIEGTILGFLPSSYMPIMDFAGLELPPGPNNADGPLNGNTARSPQDETIQDQKNLCKRCALVDWDQILARQDRIFDESDNQMVLQIERLTPDWVSPGCSLCMLLKSICPASAERLDLTLSTEIEGVCVLAFNRQNLVLTSIPFLGIASMPASEYNGDLLEIRCIDMHRVDYPLIRSWLSNCQREHKEDCGLANSKPVPSLRVINVHTRQLEWATDGCRYSALSYVWGPPEDTVHDFSVGISDTYVLQSVPATVEDSMRVTRELGIDHLWVDRYCIPQHACQQRHDQLRQMDQVYRNAELTIIDGAGKDPTFGLPGVGIRPRVPQPRARVGRHVLASSMNPPSKFAWTSPWSTRAWTYQEGICSRRILIFTEEQVFFHCRMTLRCETASELASSLKTEIFTIGMLDEFPWSIWSHISNYTRKSLTYESDGLDGFLGILRMFQDQPYPVYHCWGLPILPLIYKDASGDTKTTYRSLEESFLASLRWFTYHVETKRREQLPSWTWAGWSGPTGATVFDYNGEEWHQPTFTGHVYFHDGGGSALDFQTAFETYMIHNNSFQLLPVLTIEAWTVELHGKYFPLSSQCDSSAELSGAWCWTGNSGTSDPQDDFRIVLPLHFNWDKIQGVEMLENNGVYKLFGIILDDAILDKAIPESRDHRAQIIVARAREDEFERVGFISASYDFVQRISLSTGELFREGVLNPKKELSLQDWFTGKQTWRKFSFV